jgi:hypothetical protein
MLSHSTESCVGSHMVEKKPAEARHGLHASLLLFSVSHYIYQQFIQYIIKATYAMYQTIRYIFMVYVRIQNVHCHCIHETKKHSKIRLDLQT